MAQCNVKDLQGAALDYAVAVCEGDASQGLTAGGTKLAALIDVGGVWCKFEPSTNWAQGGPIIEREGITVSKTRHGFWESHLRTYDSKEAYQFDNSPLIAGMRCYIASKVGETIEIPNELI